MFDVIICEKPSQGRAVAEVFGAKQGRKDISKVVVY